MDREYLDFVNGTEFVVTVELVDLGLWVARTTLHGREMSARSDAPDTARNALLAAIRSELADDHTD